MKRFEVKIGLYGTPFLLDNELNLKLLLSDSFGAFPEQLQTEQAFKRLKELAETLNKAQEMQK